MLVYNLVHTKSLYDYTTTNYVDTQLNIIERFVIQVHQPFSSEF